MTDNRQTIAATSEGRKIAALRRHARKRTEESLTLIRTAASALFSRMGYTDVTMEALARTAGVTRQTLYRHFPSKYEIALDFMAGSRSQTIAAWCSLGNHDRSDRASVLAWVRSVIAHHAARPAFRAYVELASSEPAYRSVLADEIAQIIDALGKMDSFFAQAAADREGLPWAKAHLFVATLMERSDFIAIGEEWFAARHLEQIMTDWLMSFTVA